MCLPGIVYYTYIYTTGASFSIKQFVPVLPSFIKRFTSLYFYCQFGLLADSSFRVLCEERVSMQLNSVPWYGRTDHACIVCKQNRCSTDLPVCPSLLLQFSIAETLNITNTKVERLVNREGERR